MNYDRFSKIVKNTKNIENEVKEVLDEFHEKINIDCDSIKRIKDVGEAFEINVFDIPMKEKDFGAVSYKTGYSKYIFLNTNQPRCKMNFSYYHDIYHILRGSSNMLNESKDVHLNEDYLLDENECKANLFSAMIIMPERKFKLMYSQYYKSHKDLKATVYKLMSYFSAPYISVLLRICELNLIENMRDMDEYLIYDDNELINEFNILGISDEILKPTLADDSKFLYKTIEDTAKKLIKKGLMDKEKYERLKANIIRLVEGIKVNGD